MTYWPKDEKKDSLVFIHIPKTAGLSVQDWYRKRFGKFHKAMHADVKHAIVNRKIQELESFCIVRNPYDLVYSWYRYKLKMLMEERHKDPKELEIWYQGFEPWMLRYFTKYNYSNDKTTGSINAISPSKTMLDYISINNQVKVTHCIRFENLNEDMFKKLGGPKIGHVNKSGGTNDYRRAYTPSTRALVEKYYAKDLEYFSYSF